ncbi:putative amidase [Aspergillus foveolatus]|uniref:putative amidase n=1 Tax=Aspergillus foveolatus TaxID=210207 RepID=UPI003CCD2844
MQQAVLPIAQTRKFAPTATFLFNRQFAVETASSFVQNQEIPWLPCALSMFSRCGLWWASLTCYSFIPFLYSFFCLLASAHQNSRLWRVPFHLSLMPRKASFRPVSASAALPVQILLSPLHGLPILVKDLIGTFDQMDTTGGQTYAAYYEEQDPSGSSSGSAVAADLGLAFATLGTETSGSIILPAEKSNIVGIKPTVGLTSRYMVVPVSERLDTIGPMARTVRDAALVLQAIAGQDANDNYTSTSPFQTGVPEYVAACDMAGLQGKRIGIPQNVLEALFRMRHGMASPIISSFEKAVETIRDAGATIIDDTNFTAYDSYLKSDAPSRVIAADVLSGFATYLSELSSNPNNLRGLGDIRNFTQHSVEEDYPARNTQQWDMALFAGINNSSPDFWPLYQQSLRFGEEGGLLGALARHNLDAVVLPSSLASDIPGIVGTPVITVPFDSFPANTSVLYNSRGDLVDAAPGIPLGISFLGPRWSEESLIAMAYAFEQRATARDRLRRVIEPLTELQDILG